MGIDRDSFACCSATGGHHGGRTRAAGAAQEGQRAAATIQETTTTSSLPYLEETSNCDPKMHNVVSDGAPCQFTMHYVVSDGAPCQFTKHHARSATYIDWSVGTPAHKDMSDAECGGVKHDNMAIVRPVDGSRTVSL